MADEVTSPVTWEPDENAELRVIALNNDLWTQHIKMFRIPRTLMPATAQIPSTKLLKSSGCAYTNYDCSQPCLENYAYCSRHILEDPNAPYKPCGFVYNTNGRKCYNAAPKLDKRDLSYCAEHTRKTQLARIRSTSKHSLPQSPETLLLKLGHYVEEEDSEDTEDDESKGQIKCLDPFVDIDAERVNKAYSADINAESVTSKGADINAQSVNTANGGEILDYASSSDSDVEPTVVNDTLRGSFLDDSDNESLHSAQEDPLKHAGIFTAEEVIYIAREKLIRLQSLYIDQFRRLQYNFKEKRRKYLQALKKEKETLCSVHDQPKENVKEKIIYEKLKALNSYHRRSGEEAILYRKSLERRSRASEGPTQKPPSVQKCIFTEGGVKCGERTLPSAKHCRKHILKDQNQVLFKACGAMRADIECHEPVPVIFDSNCVFHMDLPAPCKLETMIFDEPKPSEICKIDMVTGHEIDPDDDMAGLMREMNDVGQKKPVFNESLNSEASTDTAFSLTAQMSDKDDLVSV